MNNIQSSINSTMDRLKRSRERQETIESLARVAHTAFLMINDNEPMDGDETSSIAQQFLLELNKLNGNE